MSNANSDSNNFDWKNNSIDWKDIVKKRSQGLRQRRRFRRSSRTGS